MGNIPNEINKQVNKLLDCINTYRSCQRHFHYHKYKNKNNIILRKFILSDKIATTVQEIYWTIELRTKSISWIEMRTYFIFL